MEEYIRKQQEAIDLTKEDDNEVESENKDNLPNQKLPEKSQEPKII